jgi:1,4-alpha-glucan branching enzyme
MPDDFKHLVDTLHQHELGVVIEWLPAYFPGDSHGLVRFDGSPLYENASRRGVDQDWNTYLFDYGQPEVADFLVSNALFWLDDYHVDGLRMDSVSMMLHRYDPSRDGGRAPDLFGGREDLEAISLLRRINDRVHTEFPGAITIAVETTAWPAISRPTIAGGLGFDYAWDVGWAHDISSYMTRDPVERKACHDLLTFRTLYAFNENYILPLARGEPAGGSSSILARMPGDEWRKAANLRLLYGYMFAQPGKKLLSLGDEPGTEPTTTETAPQSGLARWIRDLNTTYRAEPALHMCDCRPDGFSWIDCNDVAQSVLCLLRKARANDALILVVCNFTPVPRHNYRVGVPRGGEWKEILNSDATIYGGSGQGNLGGVEASPINWHGQAWSVNLVLPPLAVVAFRNEA